MRARWLDWDVWPKGQPSTKHGSVCKSQKMERRFTLKGKRENVFSGKQRDNVRNEAQKVSVMIHWTLETVRGQRRQGRSSSSASHSKAKQIDGEGQKPLTGITQ